MRRMHKEAEADGPHQGPAAARVDCHLEAKGAPPPPRGPEGATDAVGEGSQQQGAQPRPWRAPDGRQHGAGPSSAAGRESESHVLAMLPEDAQYRARRRRELDELMRREVAF